MPISTLDDFERFNDEEGQKDRQFVTALARGLEILRCFRPGEQYLGNQEIVSRTGLPKATVSRLTYTLTKLGYLGYSERMGKYHLASGVLSLGYALVTNSDLRHVARPLMQDLAEHAQASVALGARDRLHMVYVENCRSSSTLTLRLDVGSRVPIATTAMGRAFLTALPQSERDYLLDLIRSKDPENWSKIRTGVEQAQKDVEDRGFTISIGEWQKDVNAVGAPLITPDGNPMGLNCGGPAFQLRRHMLEDDIGPRLVHLASNIRAGLARR